MCSLPRYSRSTTFPAIRNQRHHVAKRRDVPSSTLASSSLRPPCVSGRNNRISEHARVCVNAVTAFRHAERNATEERERERQRREQTEKEREREKNIGENSNAKERTDSGQRVFPARISSRWEKRRERKHNPCTPPRADLPQLLSPPSVTIPFHSLSLFILPFSPAPGRAV